MAFDSTIDGTASVRPGLSRVIIAATIGNVLEIFDFVVYGFFAVTIAEVFFPASNPTVSLLVTFGTFGLGYVVRPLACPYGSAPPPIPYDDEAKWCASKQIHVVHKTDVRD